MQNLRITIIYYRRSVKFEFLELSWSALMLQQIG
ncbi:hypothetical protein OB2597_17157 [Pseudooceanicola batsensis HTCC2597]|uniref:Uncharacterized protein n=1 Tax=Pseudooceanicola batsensis (strain ATCC BAA-863 / DSM 15984 / KCTC 12145 / HTCC2597) TaxID=252305 RepID=A3TZI5_PSEBH|nr:hypothetical protein OB2597_17157 [Pseudooceanicola batsensis HTCC2597]